MLYIVLNYPPGSSKGGIEKVVREMLESFSENKKEEIIIICNGFKNTDVVFNNIPIINLETKRYKILDFLFFYSHIIFSYKLYVFLKSKLNNGDTVNIHEGDSAISTIFMLFRKRINKKNKIVIVNHGLLLMHRKNFIFNLPNKYILLKIIFCVSMPYYYIIERNYLRNADYIVTLTKKTKAFIKKYISFRSDKFKGNFMEYSVFKLK